MESKRVPREQKVKRIKYVTGHLRCQRCASKWQVIDLNPEHRAVKCPVCSEYNDINEARKRAA